MVIAYVYKLAAADGGVAQVTASAATIRRAFVAGEINALLVELEGAVVAMALFHVSFRTFTGHALYLQDWSWMRPTAAPASARCSSVC